MSQPYLGEIRLFGGNFAPVSWALCDGTTLAISQYSALFNLIGTTYGGDGQTTFNLPDLRGRVPLHQGPARSGTFYTIGEPGGSESVVLTTNQLPQHSHTFMASTGNGNQAAPQDNVLGAPTSVPLYNSLAPTAAMAPSAIASAGQNLPHENMMPFLTISFIIALEGIYPSQN